MKKPRNVELILGLSVIAVVICFGTFMILSSWFSYQNSKDAKTFAEKAVNETLNNRTIGWERGAIDCETVYLDSDRTFAMPSYCLRTEVIAFYPMEMCQALQLSSDTGCGKSQEG